jgi:hypothetical protein
VELRVEGALGHHIRGVRLLCVTLEIILFTLF